MNNYKKKYLKYKLKYIDAKYKLKGGRVEYDSIRGKYYFKEGSDYYNKYEAEFLTNIAELYQIDRDEPSVIYNYVQNAPRPTITKHDINKDRYELFRKTIAQGTNAYIARHKKDIVRGNDQGHIAWTQIIFNVLTQIETDFEQAIDKFFEEQMRLDKEVMEKYTIDLKEQLAEEARIAEKEAAEFAIKLAEEAILAKEKASRLAAEEELRKLNEEEEAMRKAQELALNEQRIADEEAAKEKIETKEIKNQLEAHMETKSAVDIHTEGMELLKNYDREFKEGLIAKADETSRKAIDLLYQSSVMGWIGQNEPLLIQLKTLINSLIDIANDRAVAIRFNVGDKIKYYDDKWIDGTVTDINYIFHKYDKDIKAAYRIRNKNDKYDYVFVDYNSTIRSVDDPSFKEHYTEEELEFKKDDMVELKIDGNWLLGKVIDVNYYEHNEDKIVPYLVLLIHNQKYAYPNELEEIRAALSPEKYEQKKKLINYLRKLDKHIQKKLNEYDSNKKIRKEIKEKYQIQNREDYNSYLQQKKSEKIAKEDVDNLLERDKL